MTKPADLKIWHPFTQVGVDPPPLRIVSAQGVYLYAEDGQPIIDAISSWWVNLHGHCHPRIVEAIAAQSGTLDHVLLASATHPAVEQLTGKLRKVVPPTAGACVLFGQWLHGGGSCAQDHGAVLAKPGPK